MKLPTEGELIEVERFISRWASADGPVLVATQDFYQHHRVWETLKTLIAVARDPSQLLKYVPFDDDALDRAMRPPRKAKLKPVLIVEPKPKKGKW